VSLDALISLPPESALWQWQPRMRYRVIEEGAFSDADLASRDTLAALLFRLENCRQADQVIELMDAVIDWFRRHDGFEALRPLFAALAGRIVEMADAAAPGVQVSEDLSGSEPYLRHAWRNGSSTGGRKGNGRAGRKARPKSCCVCLSAGSVRCQTLSGTASRARMWPIWTNGSCASWMLVASTTFCLELVGSSQVLRLSRAIHPPALIFVSHWSCAPLRHLQGPTLTCGKGCYHV
jgi:hypothetical protein